MDTNTTITGRKIKNVILGIERKEGSFEKMDREGNIIRDKKGKSELGYYDNVTIYFGTYSDEYSDTDRGTYFDGFCGQSAKSPLIQAVKIKFEDFESIFDVSYADFVADFRDKYLFHVAQILYGMSDYGEPVPCQIMVFDNDVFNFTLPNVPAKDGKTKIAEVIT